MPLVFVWMIFLVTTIVAIWRGLERAARQQERARQLEALERQWQQQPGASPDNPLVVAATSVIDARTRSQVCPLCQHALSVDQSGAKRHNGVLLHTVEARCSFCGQRRTLWFRIETPPPMS